MDFPKAKFYPLYLSKPNQISLYLVKILSLRYQEKINQADEMTTVHSFEADAMQYALTLVRPLDINNGPVLKAH